jgi:hypothetical protein
MGPSMLLLIILLSSIMGSIIGLILLKKNGESLPYPFGPYIAIAGWIALLWGDQIAKAYLGGYMSFILGITGGIGSGKSAATQWFESQGITVIDADIVAREIVEPGQPSLQTIQQSFGDWVLLEDGNLNRRALREHIFQFPEARQTLEKITHPAIRQSIIQQLQQAESPYVI